MPADESIFHVQLETQNRSLMNEVTSWSIDSDYLTTTDGFEFSCYSPDPSKVRGLEMEAVELKVNGHSQLIGRIDSSRIGHKGGEVSYQGRDYLADMVECAIDPRVTITEEMDIFAAITAVSGTVGIDTVVSDSDFAMRNIRTGKSIAGGAGRDFLTLEAGEIKPNHGMSQMGFLSRIVSRHGATIQPANARNTVHVTEPNYSQPTSYKLQRKLGNVTTGNNILRGVASRDFSRFPTYTLFSGSQAKPAQQSVGTHSHVGIGISTDIALKALGVDKLYALAGGLFKAPSRSKQDDGTRKYDTATAATGFAPSAEDVILGHCHIGRRLPADGPHDPLKLYRLLAVREKTCKNQEQLDRLAVREVGERLKDVLVYEVEVQGHTDPASGAIWSVDTMVDVLDEECDIAEPLWIASRRLSYDPTAGARTSMTLWRPGAFIT